MNNLYIGIDVIKFTHHLSVVDAQCNLIKSLSFANNSFGIRFVELLAKEFYTEKAYVIKLAMEAIGHHWILLYEQLTKRCFLCGDDQSTAVQPL